MDSKKLAFSGQLLSPRRKVVSRFGLGLAASVILLTLIFLNNSYKSPLVTPLFQGFSSVGVNSRRVVSWPFSFSTSPLNDSSSSNGIEQVKNFFDTEANVSSVDNGKEKVLENTHLGNSTRKGKDGNFSAKGGIQLKSDEVYNNGSSVPKHGTFSNPNVADMVVDNLCRGNFSEVVHNGTLPGEKGQNCRNVSSVNNVSDVNSQVSDSKNVSSLSQDQGNSADKNSSTSGSDYDSQLMKMQGSLYENCDIFDGRWVRDESKPYYPPGSCPFIDRDFDCHLNRRPDDGFLKWRWQPNGCDIPSLNATDFLENLRGKKLVFVGDSLNRNMWESLVCILRHSVKNKKRVYEISGRTEFKKKGFYAFHFKDYNCTVDFVGSPFLVRESSYKGRNGSFETLRLDLMDRTISMYHDADIIIFNTGHWWTHEKTSKGEEYYQEGNQVYPRLKVLEAYKRALSTWARWVDKNIDSSRTQVFFRGYSVTHFRGGQWNSGGQCHKETEPISSGTHLKKYPSKMRALEHVLQEMKTPIVYLNISRLTDYRKDGHPSIYRKIYKTEAERVAAEQAQDCSHWCLPGVPDTWNELLYASLLKLGMGSVRN